MNYPNLRGTFHLSVILLAAGFVHGCSTTVVPVAPPLRDIVADDNHGLLFGRIDLAQNGNHTSAPLQWPIYMNWWIEEESRGSRILLTRLLFNEPFAVKLRPGSYRVRDISFEAVGAYGMPTYRQHFAFIPTSVSR